MRDEYDVIEAIKDKVYSLFESVDTSNREELNETVEEIRTLLTELTSL